MIVLAAIASMWAIDTTGHPGGLNAEGCHNNRRTGDYHCHRSASTPAPQRAIGGSGVSFSSCAAARAAGYRRIRRGEAGYSSRLDRDGDGIACE